MRRGEIVNNGNHMEILLQHSILVITHLHDGGGGKTEKERVRVHRAVAKQLCNSYLST